MNSTNVTSINTAQNLRKKFVTYDIIIVERLEREVQIRARNICEAAEIAKKLYLKENIVLDADDHVSTAIVNKADSKVLEQW